MPKSLSQWLQASPLPKLETRMPLQRITGYTEVQLITRAQETLDETQSAALAQLVQRRSAGEPMAYILGEREFYGRTFAVSPDVLIPRSETEHLVEVALFRLPENGKLWDLGTGSGIIAITVKLERPDADVSASDVSKAALQMAQRNADTLGAQIKFAQGSWFQAALSFRQPEKRFDVIVSNPPYIEQGDAHLTQGDLRFEPQHALTDFDDGLSCIRILAAQAQAFLQPSGWLMLEHGFEQGTAVREILQRHGYRSIETQRDLAGLERLTLAQKG